MRFVKSPISVGKLDSQSPLDDKSVVSQVYSFPHTKIELVQVGLFMGWMVGKLVGLFVAWMVGKLVGLVVGFLVG